MPQYNKADIGRAATQYGFVRDTFEKVLRLKEILEYLNEQSLFVHERDLFPVISKKDNFQLEERKRQAKQYISGLMQLTEKENEYMKRFIAKEYRPELLFDDDGIVERISEHPMALWKCKR